MSNDLFTGTLPADQSSSPVVLAVVVDDSAIVEENTVTPTVAEKKKRIPRSERITKAGVPYKPHVYTEKRQQQFIEKCQAARMRSLKPVSAE